jgi:hypothetical protein
VDFGEVPVARGSRVASDVLGWIAARSIEAAAQAQASRATDDALAKARAIAPDSQLGNNRSGPSSILH